MPGRSSLCKKIELVDVETKEVIEKYDSISEAVDKNYISMTGFKHAMKERNGHMPRLGLMFRYV